MGWMQINYEYSIVGLANLGYITEWRLNIPTSASATESNWSHFGEEESQAERLLQDSQALQVGPEPGVL